MKTPLLVTTLIILICSITGVANAQGLAVCESELSDIDGDGFGWENEASCIVAASVCEDRGDYPWGWDPVKLESCRLATQSAGPCIDTDPLNDGWGWNGVTSCQMPVQTDLYQCDDVGETPWGWNPTINQSCRLDLVQSPSYPTNNFVGLDLAAVAFADFLDVNLVCRKLVWDYYCNCDNSITDNVARADEFDDVFFTFTLKDLNQSEEVRDTTYQTLSIDGTWDQQWSNSGPAYYKDDLTHLSYAPSPGQSFPFFGSMRFYKNESDDIFISQFDGLVGGNDLTTVSHCVVQ